jgi:VWFA-related protein
MARSRRILTPLCLVGIAAASLVAQQPPVFRGGADVVLVDAQVVDRDGVPVKGLTERDFSVRLGGQRRTVLSVEFIDATAVASAIDVSTPTDAVTEDAADPARRLYVIAVDESSFSAASALAWKAAISRFVKQLAPADLAALVAYPAGGPLVPPTRDRERLLSQVDLITGQLDWPQVKYRLSRGEVADITAGDSDVTRRVAQRECAKIELMHCINTDLPREALMFALELEARQAQSIAGLQAVIRGVAELPQRKTLVVVSGGLFSSDRIASRGDVNTLIDNVARDADRANLNLYVLHLDTTFLDAFSPMARGPAAGGLRDSTLLGLGLERFAGAAGGELIRVQAGTGDNAFARVLRETSGYYLLSVQPEDRDRDGRPRRIAVSVSQRGTTVRHRAWVTVPAPG